MFEPDRPKIDKRKLARQRAIAQLAKFVERNWYDTDWTILANMMGVEYILDEPRHERVRRAQRFGDDDYPDAILKFLQEIFESDEEVGLYFVTELIRLGNSDIAALDDEAKKELQQILSGFEYNDTDSQEFNLLSILEFDLAAPKDLFKYQFPAGLPFGKPKPALAVVPEHGGQRMYFEDTPTLGIIRDGVYPNFCAYQLRQIFQGKTIGGKALLPAMLSMNTKSEAKLFQAYASNYQMWNSEKVPVLIPQAWIQWHSLPKQNLRAVGSSYADDIYRIDFVAFWNSKRFAILVDDIGHYAVKRGNKWDASEEAYSKRLKEDRKLRKQGWNVFRVSNWEMRRDNFVEEILDDLREFIDF